jgi:3-oxoadipate enol-lactonase
MKATLIVSLLIGAGIAGAEAQSADRYSADGLRYQIDGRGPDVVLVHAFQMDLREWDEVVPDLAQSHRVLRYDVRGHGRSRFTEPLPSPVADLLALLDELKIGRAVLVGSSMGSTIALDFALTHPDRVDRLVLLSPGIPGSKITAGFDWMQPILEAVRNHDPTRAAELWWECPLMSGARQRPEAARYRSVVMDNARIWTITSRPPGLSPPAGTRLKDVKAPVLVVAGALDRYGSLEVTRVVAEGVPNGRSLLVDGAGHMLAIEKPSDVTRAILSAR